MLTRTALVAPRTSQRVLSGRRGMLLLVDQGIGEGFSGGPVLQGGKVVGVVTDTDAQTTYAVNSVVAREALEGWGVMLGRQQGVAVVGTTKQAIQPPASPQPDAASKPINEAEHRKMEQVAQVLLHGSASDLRAAFKLAREVADEHPDWREAQYLAAETAYRTSRWSDTITYFHRGGDPKEGEPELLFYLAVALYKTGKIPEAAAALRRSLPNLQRTPYVDAYARKILKIP